MAEWVADHRHPFLSALDANHIDPRQGLTSAPRLYQNEEVGCRPGLEVLPGLLMQARR